MPTPRTNFLIGLLFSLLLASGCSMLPTRTDSSDFPPILTQDELIKPYVQLGRIQVTRDIYGIIDPEISPDIREWAYNAMRAEAGKMDADAVIFPEVRGTTETYLIIPTTEYRATGIAIKFK